MTDFVPVYIGTRKTGLLGEKIRKSREKLRKCDLCPRKCGVNRLEDKTGICRTGKLAWVSSFNPHFGEEAPLVGKCGSGTIFFTHCNLLCLFCQNFDISHQGNGEEKSDEQLANMMMILQKMGCHNINFVTPTHVVPQILSALDLAIESGLKIPLIYNSGGYEEIETLRLLDGVIDIYMPDFKFWDEEIARLTCGTPDYPEKARQAFKEMQRQVGDLKLDESGIATKGLLVRHLVMPKGTAGTQEVMRFLAKEISVNTYVNIMFQYRPMGRAHEIPQISEPPTREDFLSALQAARDEGIHRLDNPDPRFFNW